MAMRACPKCGEMISDSATTCPYCGALVAVPKAMRNCPSCGAKNLSESNYCQKCGCSFVDDTHDDSNRSEAISKNKKPKDARFLLIMALIRGFLGGTAIVFAIICWCLSNELTRVEGSIYLCSGFFLFIFGGVLTFPDVLKFN